MFLLGIVMVFSPMYPVNAATDQPPASKPQVTELNLDQTVNMALTNNPTGKIAVFDFEAAKGALTAARSYRWPTLSATHRDSWTWAGRRASLINYGDANYVSDTFSNSVTASWTLWAGNRIES